MNNLNDQVKKQIWRDIYKMRKKVERFPELPDIPDAEVYLSILGNIDIHIPFDRNRMEKDKALMEAAGWELKSRTSAGRESRGLAYSRFRKDGIRVDLEYKVNMPGAVCERKLIGTRIVEEPVYEFVCSEGAQEDVYD